MSYVATPFGPCPATDVATVSANATLVKRGHQVEIVSGRTRQSFTSGHLAGRTQRGDSGLTGIGWFNTRRRAAGGLAASFEVPSSGSDGPVFAAVGMSGGDLAADLTTTVHWAPTMTTPTSPITPTGPGRWECITWFTVDGLILRARAHPLRSGTVATPVIRLTGRDSSGYHYQAGLEGVAATMLHLVSDVSLDWLHAGYHGLAATAWGPTLRLRGLRNLSDELCSPVPWSVLRAGATAPQVEHSPAGCDLTVVLPQRVPAVQAPEPTMDTVLAA